MAKPIGFENVVSSDPCNLKDGEFEQFLKLGGVHEGRGRRGVAMSYGLDEMERSDEKIRLQGRVSRHGVSVEEIPAPVAEEKFVSVIETGDFRPLTFLTGQPATKVGAPARRPNLPAVTVHRRGYNLLFRGA